MCIYVISLCVHSSLQKNNEDPKKTLRPKAYEPFCIKNNKLWGCDKTKQLGVVNSGAGTGKYMGEPNGRSGLF